uniref:Guanylate cyclase domain-containing protein n=1 Tax=Tetraselmis chuii TaxID=63592 RepID=A0A7S1X304_9CHLO|mmetsp:Transcript_23515/g.41779  ORF Transcript_23515/g.41779 Transcript_23515/m.41779 type:complete len:217 (+) Transcript_23515:117-767(+)
MGCTSSVNAGNFTWVPETGSSSKASQAGGETGQSSSLHLHQRFANFCHRRNRNKDVASLATDTSETRTARGDEGSSENLERAGGKITDDPGEWDSKWEEEARALAAVTMPFLPARVCVAFAAGNLTSQGSGGMSPPAVTTGPRRAAVKVLRSPPPRVIHAALLIVDVSGFTALSEDARRRLGAEGVEAFSLALSAFFAEMMQLFSRFRGDVDCFAV